MSGEGRLDIAYLTSGQAGDPGLMSSATGPINEVYAAAEKWLWAEGATRTTLREVESGFSNSMYAWASSACWPHPLDGAVSASAAS